jgi:hypothetical protein
MAINLRKICRDVENPDEELQVLALTTVCQITATSVENPAELLALKAALLRTIQSSSQDTVFMARKAMNRVDELLAKLPASALAGAAPGTPGAPPATGSEARPPELSREEVLAGLSVEADPVKLATLVARLGRVGEPVDWVLAVPLLKSADARVRSNAVELVERIPDQAQVTELLTPLLSDENNRVRGNVAKALGRIGVPKIAKYLKSMLRSPKVSMRESAVYAISHIIGEPMVDLLIEALRDPYEGIRLRAVRGLKIHNAERALPAIRPLLNDLDIDVCEEARKAIRVIRKDQALTQAAELFDIETMAARDAEKRAQAAAAAAEGGVGGMPMQVTGPIDTSQLGSTFAASKQKTAELLQQQADKMLARKVGAAALNLEGRTRLELEEMLRAEQKGLGWDVFKRVRANELSHQALSVLYYDILKCQETLKRHQERAKTEQKQDAGFFVSLKLKLGAKPAEEDPVVRLERRIEQTYVLLGQKAAELAHAGKLDLGSLEAPERIGAIQAKLAESGGPQ